MLPELSIIIPTHNSASAIDRCINSLNAQSYHREKYENIIVDDGSKDKTIELAKKAGVDKIIETEPCFQGKARNIGVKNSKGDFVAFIDSDCLAKEGWIKAVFDGLSSKGAITGPIENGNPQSHVAWVEYLVEFGGWSQYREQSFVPFFPGCNGACKKDDFLRAGGFVESEASEDVLFGISLRRAGINLRFIPEMQVLHLCRTSLKNVLKNMEKLGRYFVKARRKEPTLPYSFILRNRIFLPSIFVGKTIKTAKYAIHTKKIGRFLFLFPLILLATSSHCLGACKEY